MAKRIEELLAQREGRAVDFKLDSNSTKKIVKDSSSPSATRLAVRS